ncbi:BadF/BadG/BcrA/BcrD ATPase family protein [Fuscovulum ytuae]|uniref:BadF/BadG/BcrA/BcrD ATPase family protein n=1 Tax=Fuscovulum ytuae TaxID=3042299 RepID=A0ABY8Q2Q9_9RHOB|nr:BadF/BadG/BcrA/BcrD ATPase family protein [Fuscovulum sp. YMD61]WGV15128.1 BadF/BadG/BcrA/BcrD ATPase family protein [Fuscovulum sp. YMD61]
MQLFLGIDGGGTGCRAAVADVAGHVLGRGAAGPANIASDPDKAAENILAAAGEALAAAGGGAVAAAGLGLAGANAAGATERLREALPWPRVAVVTDGITAVKGALGPDDGVVVALGTGSVFAVQRAGMIRQIGGRGLVLGDEASGAWIGRTVLARALRAVDGFSDMTPLLAGLLDEMGGPDGIVAFSLRARPADFATLAPRVVTSGDPAAVAVMMQAEADVAEAVALLRASDDLPVVFLGGLGTAFAKRMAERFAICAARGTALDGALLLAREAA